MKIIYTPIIKPKIIDCYIIKIEYEHGDADSTTYEEVNLESISSEDFIRYVERFNEIKKMISDNRSYSIDYKEELDTEMKFLGYCLPLEYDHHYSGYFAAMSIDSIRYFDKSSQEFEVTLSKYQKHRGIRL